MCTVDPSWKTDNDIRLSRNRQRCITCTQRSCLVSRQCSCWVINVKGHRHNPSAHTHGFFRLLDPIKTQIWLLMFQLSAFFSFTFTVVGMSPYLDIRQMQIFLVRCSSCMHCAKTCLQNDLLAYMYMSSWTLSSAHSVTLAGTVWHQTLSWQI